MATEDRPRRGGIAPYGWRWVRTATARRGELMRDEHEQHVRWLILHLHRQGRSLPQIAGELLALNLGTRDGGETWPKTTLHRIIAQASQVAELEERRKHERRQQDRRLERTG